MSAPIDKSQDQEITPAQLCIGLHVHIDLPWMEHPFTFSSFKIKSLEQIATLQSLGLKGIRYSPSKSDAEPLRDPAAATFSVDLSDEIDAPPMQQPKSDPIYQAKRARIERLALQRERLARCEKEFYSSSKAVRSITQNLFSRPEEARLEATTLIHDMADSMLTDADMAVNLMKDRVRGEEVYFHSLNVALLSMMLAKELKAPPEAIRLVGVGAMFHDVGKMDLPDRVVKKTDPLTKPEMALFQQHCAKGLEAGAKLNLLPEVMTIIAQHHEHVDGTGYPKGLKGPQISLLAKIVGIVNAYDNLCNPNNPAKAMTPHEALSTLYAQQRGQFEAIPLNTFVRCLGIYPPGTIVVLSNDSIGIVLSVNSTRPLKPTVMVYDPDVPKDEAIVVDLEEEPDVSISRALKPQQLTQPMFDYLSPRKRTAYYFDSEPSGRGA